MVSKSVLVVDDDSDLVSLLQGWLEEDQHEVYTAGDGWEGFRAFTEHQPWLTITDLRMPHMDGFKLISHIREISDGHILALTALQDEGHEIRSLELGTDEYLVKPIS